MSWKYSMPYTTRDLSSTRDSSSQSKFGSLPASSKFGVERQSRWSASNVAADPPKSYRLCGSQTEHSPMRAKASVVENPSSVVQRLKERYSSSGSSSNPSPSDSSSDKLNSRSENVFTSYSHRPYGRSITSSNLGSGIATPKQTSYDAETKRDYTPGKTGLNESRPSSLKLDGTGIGRFGVRKTTDKSPDESVGHESRFRRSDSVQSYESKIYSPKSPLSPYTTNRFLPNSFKGGERTPCSGAGEKMEKDVGQQQQEHDDGDTGEGEVVTVIARGTSPSQTTSSIYLRSRRNDFGIEKKIHRPKIKPPFSHKETQTDRTEESHFSKYVLGDGSSRIKPWSNYVDRYSTGSSALSSISRFSRSSYKDSGKESVSSPTRADHFGLGCRRSISRESSSLEAKSPDSVPRTPDSPQTPKSLCEGSKQGDAPVTSKPPTSFRSTETLKLNLHKPVSPSRDGDKAVPSRKPTKPLKIDAAAPTSDDRANSPTLNGVSDWNKKISPVKSKASPEGESPTKRDAAGDKAGLVNGTAAGFRSPSPATRVSHSILDGSSMSESSSDEDETSSSDEEVERIKASETSFIKKSITNFLQNIPTALPPRKQASNADLVHRSKSGVYQKFSAHLGPPPKITVNRIESGERAWWMDNGEVPEGVIKILSNCCLAKQEQSNDAQGNDRQRGESLAVLPRSGNGSDSNALTAGDSAAQPNTNSFASDLNTNSYLGGRMIAPYLLNRQFTTDMDWLKGSHDDLSRQKDPPEGVKWSLDGNNNISERNEEEATKSTTCITATTTTTTTTTNPCREDNIAETENINCDSSNVNEIGGSPNDGSGINNCENDSNVGNTPRIRDNFDFNNQNACVNIDNYSRNAGSEVVPAEIRGILLEDGEDPIDVTPALRRRREQQQQQQQNRGKSPEQGTANLQLRQEVGDREEEEEEEGMKERPVPQIHQNGIASPVEEKSAVDLCDMSGMISKAKAGLAKSKTKLDVRKSSSREMSPKIIDHGKHEIELYWKELVDSLNRPLRLCDLDFTDLNTDDEADVLAGHREEGEIPPPPPMLILPLPPTARAELKVPAPPACLNPPSSRPKVPAPPPMPQPKNKKTVKLFWKEVKDEPVLGIRSAGGPLIWDELGKVDVDTQKLEYLFESRAKDLITKKQQEQNKSKEIIVLDHKRSNAINIGMTKLPPPRAIKTAILKMDSTVVNKEGIEKLLTMLPTEEERLRIQDAQSSNPELPLGSAEQFLLILASISELEARLKLWAFKLDFENSEREICEPLMDLKQGIEILRSNKTFRAILSTLLSVGNFLNGCDVKGFQIDYLSKVPEVKDTVQKHSLLHHLCAIVMEKFPDSTDLYSEIGAVTRASKVDFDELAGNIRKIEEECKLSWNYLKMIAKHEGHTAMKVKMSDFLADCAERIIVVGIVHKRITSRYHKFLLWLGIPANRLSIARPNEIFKIISEFALEYRTTRERILQQLKKMNHREKSRSRGCLAGDSSDFARKMNSKEAKDDAKLRQLLSNESTCSENMHNTSTWRRHRKDINTRNLADLTNNNNDDEIIETLIKTANQIPSHRPSVKDRRRTNRVIDRNF